LPSTTDGLDEHGLIDREIHACRAEVRQRRETHEPSGQTGGPTADLSGQFGDLERGGGAGGSPPPRGERGADRRVRLCRTLSVLRPVSQSPAAEAGFASASSQVFALRLLVRKVSGTHRYLLTRKGTQLCTAVLHLNHAEIKDVANFAA
jgi:hypothetical protein